MMFVYHQLHSLMGGMRPFSSSDPDESQTILSALAAEHSRGRGIFGFLTAEELRNLRMNRELRNDIESFPIGIDTDKYETLTYDLRQGEPGGPENQPLLAWRQAHPQARNIRIRPDLWMGQRRFYTATIIRFLNVPGSKLDRLEIERLGLQNEVFRHIPPLKELNVAYNSALSAEGFNLLDVSRLEVLDAYDTQIDEPNIQRMRSLRKIRLGYQFTYRPEFKLRNPDLSMLPLLQEADFMSVQFMGIPRLPPSVRVLSLGTIPASEGFDLNRYISSFQLEELSLRDVFSITPFIFPKSLKKLTLFKLTTPLLSESFINLTELTHLTISECVGTLNNDTFKTFKNLRVLAIVDTVFDTDGNVFKNLPNLTDFDVDGNVLERMAPLRFSSPINIHYGPF